MLLIWQIPRAAGHALAQRAIAAAELPRVEGRDVGHVAFFLGRGRAARVAPRRGPARAEALDPRLRVAAQEHVGLIVPFLPGVFSEYVQSERVRDRLQHAAYHSSADDDHAMTVRTRRLPDGVERT